MIVLFLGMIVLLLALNMAYAEFRLKRNLPEIDIGARYAKLMLLRKYK